MTKSRFLNSIRLISAFILVFTFQVGFGQQKIANTTTNDKFWDHVQFGGAIGLGFGSGFTDIVLAPSAIYNLNEYMALGAGLQYKFLKQKDFYTSHLYGASAIALLNPIPEIQLSAEVEQLRVNLRFDGNTAPPENFWNTALFVGVGYRSGNATVGVRYNVIEDKNNLYGSAFMPFVRFYF